MKKVIFASLAAMLGVIPAFAQAHLDPRASMLISATEAASSPASRAGAELSVLPEFSADSYVTVLVRLSDPSDISPVTGLCLKAGPVRAGMTLVTLTPDMLVKLTRTPGIESISLDGLNSTKMREARANSGVDMIHAGTGLDKAYTGKGVVCGLMDIGFDPNHINFTDASGNTRIRRLWEITGQQSAVREYATPSAIAGYTTDNSDETHGTHVLGIMAGGYRGKIKQAIMRNGKPFTSSTANNYYYGVAPDADLAPCVGTLDGNNILLAAEKILAYAKSEGKPAVLNLSLGHNFGPHDGTTDANRYLAEVGKEMLITVSAGNEGADSISIRKTFTASDRRVSTMISANTAASGAVDIWSFDDTKVDVTIAGVNRKTGAVVFSYKLDSNSEGSVYLTGSRFTNSSYLHPEGFEKCFGAEGYIIVTPSTNKNNNRFNTYITVRTQNGTDENVVPAVIVEGTAGKTVDIYAHGTSLRSNGLPGFTAGTPANSISDMACGANILAVGAHVNKTEWAYLNSLNTVHFTASTTKDDIADFSSYGTTADGRQLPDISGPGMGMISSVSSYNTEKGSQGRYLVAEYTGAKNRKYYWEQMSGTSMSAPFVAGVMALWLEADPSLTVDEVKNILKETAVHDEFTDAAPARFGMGKIDALAGIKKILNINSGLNGVKADNDILITGSGRVYNIYAPGAGGIRASLVSMAGIEAAALNTDADEADFDLSSVAPGLYVLTVRAASGMKTMKVKL